MHSDLIYGEDECVWERISSLMDSSMHSLGGTWVSDLSCSLSDDYNEMEGKCNQMF